MIYLKIKLSQLFDWLYLYKFIELGIYFVI